MTRALGQSPTQAEVWAAASEIARDFPKLLGVVARREQGRDSEDEVRGAFRVSTGTTTAWSPRPSCDA